MDSRYYGHPNQQHPPPSSSPYHHASYHRNTQNHPQPIPSPSPLQTQPSIPSTQSSRRHSSISSHHHQTQQQSHSIAKLQQLTERCQSIPPERIQGDSPPQSHVSSLTLPSRPASVAPNYIGYSNYYPNMQSNMQAVSRTESPVPPLAAPPKQSRTSSSGSKSKSSRSASSSSYSSQSATQNIMPPTSAPPSIPHNYGSYAQYGHQYQFAAASHHFFGPTGAFLQQNAMSMIHSHSGPGTGTPNQFQDPRTGQATAYGYPPYPTHHSLMPQLNPSMRR